MQKQWVVSFYTTPLQQFKNFVGFVRGARLLVHLWWNKEGMTGIYGHFSEQNFKNFLFHKSNSVQYQ